MSAALNGLGHQLFGWLGPLSIELAALALLVLAVGRVTRSPALRHLLWLAVLVKPLVAVVVSSPYTILAPLAPLAEPGWDAIAHGRVEHLAALAPVGATTASTSAPLTAVGWAALLWLVGATLLTVRILVGFGILRRMRRQALVQRDGPLFAALRQARAALHYHPRGEVANLPFHPLADGPRHPETPHRRSHPGRREAQPWRALPGSHARAGPRAPLRQPLAAAAETGHRRLCSSTPPCGCAAACFGAKPNGPATISWYAPPATRKPMRTASPWSPKGRPSRTLQPGESP